MKFLLRNALTFVLISCFLFLASHAMAAKQQLAPCEKKAQKLWREFIANRKFAWSDYVDQLSVILKGQKRYKKILSILKRNRDVKETYKLLEALERGLGLDDEQTTHELEILFDPDGNKFGRYNKYQQAGLGAVALLCERIDGKSVEECTGPWN